MKIKQIGNYNGDIVKTILENRGIEDKELLLNPTSDDNIYPYNLDNMKYGIDTLLGAISNNHKIGIIVDPDADGYTSASIVYQRIKALDENIDLDFFIHEEKAHGLTSKIMEKVLKSEVNLLIIPDAGSNNIEELKKLRSLDIKTIVLDHHNIEEYLDPEIAIIINNHSKFNKETNPQYVGAGVALKFCEAIDIRLKENKTEDLYDLAAIGQVGDGSDITDNEIRYIVFKGLNNLKNNFIRTVLSESFDDITKIAPINLSFSIIPMINAVVRVGTLEERILLFEAVNNINKDRVFHVVKKRKNKLTGKFDDVDFYYNLYEYTYDICTKVRSRQAGIVKKLVPILQETIDDSSSIAIGIIEDNQEYKNITGLIANKFVNTLRKPVLLMSKVKDEESYFYRGSARGYEKIVPSLRDWCRDTDLVEYASGHDNAFGISVPEENIDDFKDKSKNVEKVDSTYEVDILFEQSEAGPIYAVDRHNYILGGKVTEPLFAYVGIKVDKNSIRQRGKMLTFYNKGVQYTMFDAPDGLFEELTHNFDKYVTMDFVGTPSINRWGNREQPNIILHDCQRNEGDKDCVIKKEITAENISF